MIEKTKKEYTFLPFANRKLNIFIFPSLHNYYGKTKNGCHNILNALMQMLQNSKLTK